MAVTSHVKRLSSFQKLRLQQLKKYAAQRLPSAGLSIISDDCWAGRFYSEFGVLCRSPTVGMGFTPSEYVPFLKQIREPDALKVLSVSSAERGYPIIQTPHARLFGKHYNSDGEFVRRWQRRVPLIDWDRMYVKVDFGKTNYTEDDILLWNELKLPRSVALYPDSPRFNALSIHHGVATKLSSSNGYFMFRYSCHFFDIFEWLRSGHLIAPPRWSPVYRLLIRYNFIQNTIRRALS
jgi:uncharacterized protein (DUF1919 family)